MEYPFQDNAKWFSKDYKSIFEFTGVIMNEVQNFQPFKEEEGRPM